MEPVRQNISAPARSPPVLMDQGPCYERGSTRFESSQGDPASAGGSRREPATLAHRVRLSAEALIITHLGVAQPGRAPASGAGDRGFESPHPDQTVRPCPEGAGASLRSLTHQVRVLAGAPQGETGSREAHNLASAGAIPAPATAMIPWWKAALIRPTQRVRLPPSRRRTHLGEAYVGQARASGARERGFDSLHPDRERAGRASWRPHLHHKQATAGFDPLVPYKCRRSPMAGGDRLRSGTVWVRLPPPAPSSPARGPGRARASYKRHARVRFPARGPRSRCTIRGRTVR